MEGSRYKFPAGTSEQSGLRRINQGYGLSGLDTRHVGASIAVQNGIVRFGTDKAIHHGLT